jgi:serine/threonine protein kinase
MLTGLTPPPPSPHLTPPPHCRYYLQMLCRLEMTSTTRSDPIVSNRKVFHGTIFDKMFDNIYQQRDQQLEGDTNHNHGIGPGGPRHGNGESKYQRNNLPPISKSKIRGSGLVGTVQYMAPEMLVDLHNYTEAVDWWSCGVLMFECMTRKRLFEGSNHALVTQDIMKCDIAARLEKYSDLLDSTSLDLLLNMLQQDPKDRFGEFDIKNHRFFSHFTERISLTNGLVAKMYSTSNFKLKSELSAADATCLTLPSKDFENLSTSYSKYKPKEKPLDKVSDPLREKRITEFFSTDQQEPSARATTTRSVKTMDGSKGKYHLPQLLEESHSSQNGQLMSFSDC